MRPVRTAADRWLIVNADDFGQNAGINRGVIAAFEHGIVTSASLMVRWPASSRAAEYARVHSGLSLGLHLDLGEWVYRDERWEPIYQVVRSPTPAGYRRELDHQLDIFRVLTGRDPTHLDSHQHVHTQEPLRSMLLEVADDLGIPARNLDPRVRYDGSFYGQSGRGYPVPHAIEVESLVHLIETLPAGLTELGCHPGDAEPTAGSMYDAERAHEVRTLCDPRVREQIQSAGVNLCSFLDLAPGGKLAHQASRARQ